MERISKITGEPVRNYTRKKNIEQPVVLEVNLHGLIVPIGTIFSLSNNVNSSASRYIVNSIINTKTINIQGVNKDNVRTGLKSNYSIDSLNKQLYLKLWSVLNPTKEIIEKINNYSNIVKYTDFKFTSLRENTKNGVVFGESHVMLLEGSYIPVSKGFTGNCQLSVIGYMSTLIQKSTNLIEQLIQIYRLCGRKLLLCDIKKDVLPKLKEKIKGEAINSEMNYVSSNGNNMVIVIIDLSKL